ncbi:MAG: MFS transporter [Spirochaetes bacterium]|nr:MFS transporter [Spirochaetota bacterium]
MPQWKRNLIVLWITQVLSLMGFNFVLPFLPYYIQELGVREAESLRMWTGVIASAPALSFAVVSPFWGMAADRWGKKLMILRAMIAGGIIMMLYAFCATVQSVAALRVIQGFFTGTIAASTTMVAAGTPRNKLSYALGFLSSSNYIGTSLGPLVGGVFAESFGFRTTFIVGGVILFIGAIIVIVYVEELNEKGIPEETTILDREGMAKGNGTEPFPLRNLLHRSFLTLFFLLFILRIARNIANPFIALYIQDVRGTMEGAPSLMGLISAGSGLLTALAGVTLVRLGDSRPRERLLKNLFLISAVTALPMGFTGSVTGFSISFLVSSYFMGGIEPIIQSSMSIIAPQNRKGIVFGVQTTIGSLGWFVAPLIGSYVSIQFGIHEVFLALSVVLFLSWGASEYFFRRFPRSVEEALSQEGKNHIH